jgi:type IV secretory pathway VirJ component
MPNNMQQLLNKKSLTFFVFNLLFFFNPLLGQDKKLPLIVSKSDSTQYLVFHITGDGGWRGFDIKLADAFKSHQMSYVYLNALKYFWKAKTPDQIAIDIIPAINYYLNKWDKKELILVGFSFGAEIIPFVYNRLPDDIKQKVKLVVSITPASTSDFTIHVSDMMGVDRHYKYDVVKEVEKIKTTKVLVMFGEKEDSTFPKNMKQENLKITFTKGGHHFTDAKAVMNIILSEF